MTEISVAELALLAAAGLAAGAINAVAGGGSLVSFPVLVAVGLPPITANATNQVGVLPGYVGGSLAYRRELEGQRPRAVALGVTSAAGAVAGAVLLVLSPERLFERIAPLLVLFSCVLLAAQPRIARAVARAGRAADRGHRSPALHAGNFVASVYGGYFGAGLGIVLLAILALGLRDGVQRLNALKGLLSLVVSAAAVAYLALFGPVVWGAAAVVAATSLVGGQAGVGVARRLSNRELRWAVVAVGVVAGAWLALR